MTTDADRWPRVEAVCHEALARDPRDRAAFLADACADDSGVRREVEALLAKAPPVDLSEPRHCHGGQGRSALEMTAALPDPGRESDSGLPARDSKAQQARLVRREAEEPAGA